MTLSEERIENFNKVSPSVRKYYEESVDESKANHATKLWVYFNTKHDPSVERKQYDGSNLSKRSLARRARRVVSEKHVFDETDMPVQEALIKEVMQCGNEAHITLYQRSKWLNSISISIDSSASETVMHCITSLPFVERIELVTKFIRSSESDSDLSHVAEKVRQTQNLVSRKLMSASLEDQLFYNNTYNGAVQVNIPEAHHAGYNGSGLVVLMMDSGFLLTHEAFKHLKVIGQHDFINNLDTVQGPMGDDQNTHGTATLSTIAGYMPGVMVGPAYDATFLLAKTEDTAHEVIQEEDYWISALEWGESLGAELVSSSLGYTDWYKYYNMNASVAAITRAADMAVDKGLTVVVSAGNNGNRGIGAPADGKRVIAVGAAMLMGSPTDFSSGGPSADGRMKPDISALGLKNFVASAKGVNQYTRMSGTSFACPLVAGSIALVMQAHPEWTPEQVYKAVTSTGSLANSPNTRSGFGILDSMSAINYKDPLDETATCETLGCSGHGGCCSGKCQCAPDHYGRFCQFPKVACGVDCVNRGGRCLTDSHGLSFVCGNVHDTVPVDNTTLCNACDSKIDVCGVCGGKGVSCLGCDGVAFSGKVIDSCGKCGGSGNCKAVVPEEGSSIPYNANRDKKRIALILGSALSAIAGLTLLTVLAVFYHKRRNAASRGGRSEIEFFPLVEIQDPIAELAAGGSPTIYTIEELSL
eukprot:gene11534-13461_t